MKSNKDIQAIIRLLDDPNQEVGNSILQNLRSYGPDIIPELEKIWENTPDSLVQARLEEVIQDIQQEFVKEKLIYWITNDSRDLLEGAWLIARYQYPELSLESLSQQIEKITRETWLEINENLTALEKIRILNYVLYKSFKFSGNFTNFYAPQYNFINHVLDNRRGNPITMGITYLLVSQALELPVYGVNLPDNFVLVYMDEEKAPETFEADLDAHILFYINPYRNGTVVNRNEIKAFLLSQKVELLPEYFLPCSNRVIIHKLIGNIVFAFEKMGYTEKVENFRQLEGLFNQP